MDTEVLETNEVIVPNELLDYLKEDEKALDIFNSKIEEIISKENELEKEKEEKEKEFEDRLEEFKKNLEKEKEDQAKIFGDRAKELTDEKEKIESVKSEQENKKQDYISSLININDSYNSKINSIKSAIDVAPDNDMLKKAVEEEQEKLSNDLSKELETRKTEIDKALELVGEKKEEPVVEEPKVTEIPVEEPTIVPLEPIVETHDNNEVVSHESREDVINVIYGSSEVMEGHVFPYLNGLLGE
jgi:DNA repair exonuclease SbcCD ATPase subunit